MVLKADSQGGSQLDWFKWLVGIAVLLAGLIVNHYYSEISTPIRMLAWLAVLAISGFILSTTQKGKWVIGFFRGARTELRKVVWPTREETMQTTLVVAAMVIVLALILWGIDGTLVWIIGLLTGQRG